VAKVSISIDDADLRWLRARAKRVHGGNLSAAVAEGTRLVRHREALGALLDELGAPRLSIAELDAAASELKGTDEPGTSAERRPTARRAHEPRRGRRRDG
jgi:hypothetical protein